MGVKRSAGMLGQRKAGGSQAIDDYPNIRALRRELAKIVSAHLDLPLATIFGLWNETHRVYHGLSHLDDLLGQVGAHGGGDRVALVLMALMHDIIYNPRASNNEDASRAFFVNHVKASSPFKKVVAEGIEATRYMEGRPAAGVIRTFLLMDLKGLLTGDMNRLLADEMNIFREYQWVDYSAYRAARPDVLLRIAGGHAYLLPAKERPAALSRVKALADYIRTRRPNVGVYAGSFNPFHVGHMNILNQAEKIFDKVIVAVGMNPDKEEQRPWEIVAGARTAAIERALPFRQVEAFRGFLADYLRKKGEDQEVTLIRGIRDGFDLRQEVIQLRYIQEQYPELKVVYIPCRKEYEHISSSSLRMLEAVEPGSSAQYVCGAQREEWFEKTGRKVERSRRPAGPKTRRNA